RGAMEAHGFEFARVLQAAAIGVAPGRAERKPESDRLCAQRARAHAGVFAGDDGRCVGGADGIARIVGVDVHVLVRIVRARIVVGVALVLALSLLLRIARARIVVAVIVAVVVGAGGAAIGRIGVGGVVGVGVVGGAAIGGVVVGRIVGVGVDRAAAVCGTRIVGVVGVGVGRAAARRVSAGGVAAEGGI